MSKSINCKDNITYIESAMQLGEQYSCSGIYFVGGRQHISNLCLAYSMGNQIAGRVTPADSVDSSIGHFYLRYMLIDI